MPGIGLFFTTHISDERPILWTDYMVEQCLQHTHYIGQISETQTFQIVNEGWIRAAQMVKGDGKPAVNSDGMLVIWWVLS